MPATSIQNDVRPACPAISVGLLTADMMMLGSEARLLEKAGVRLLHFDVMDGVFCPMMTVGPLFIKGIKTSLLKDVHLMIEDPLGKLESFAAAGADILTVHVEATRHPHRALQAIGQLTNANDPQRGILRGIALNPGTPVEAVKPLLQEADMITLLAVNPGWGGQKFIGTTPARMAQLLDLIRGSGRDILAGVDGGITLDNVGAAVRMGADVIVTGSAVFNGKDAEANARSMLDAVTRARKV
jgi:ribulose-phosphate 3-epimerase